MLASRLFGGHISAALIALVVNSFGVNVLASSGERAKTANVAYIVLVGVCAGFTRLDSCCHIRFTYIALAVGYLSIVYVDEVSAAFCTRGYKLCTNVAVSVCILIYVRNITSEYTAALVAYSVVVNVDVSVADIELFTNVALCVQILVYMLITFDFNVLSAEAALAVVIVIDVLFTRCKVSSAVVALSAVRVRQVVKMLNAGCVFIDFEDGVVKPGICFLSRN